jgi:hypothetical protein
MSYQQFSKVMSLPQTPSFQQIQLCLHKILSRAIRPSQINLISSSYEYALCL